MIILSINLSLKDVADVVSNILHIDFDFSNKVYTVITSDKMSTDKCISDTVYEIRELSKDCIELLKYENGRYILCVEINTDISQEILIRELTHILEYPSNNPTCWCIIPDGKSVNSYVNSDWTDLLRD